MTLEVIGEVGFSCSFGSFDEAVLFDAYRFLLTFISRIAMAPPFASWLWIKDRIKYYQCRTRINTVIEQIVRQRLAEQESDDKPRHADLLSYLVSEDDDGCRLSYKYIFGNTRMFVFAGHDTTAAALAGTLWELAKHPSAQTKLQSEVDTVFKEDSTSPPSYKDGMQLKYLDAVVREGLRLHSPGAVGRTLVENITIHDAKGRPFTVPAGTGIYSFACIGHHYEEYFPNALEFRPERFMGSSAEDANKNWYPFSYGPRNCVGQPLAMAELKIILLHIMRRYTLRVNAEAVEPIDVLTLVAKPHQVLLDVERR